MCFILTLQAAGAPWQTKDKVTLALSIAGAALSLVTLYLTVLRPAAIRVFLGDFLIVRLTWDGYVFIAPELGLYNAGAKVGTVFKISGKLAGLDADRGIDLRWKEVWEVKNVATVNEPRKISWEFASFPELIVVPKSETALRRLCFVTVNPFTLSPGRYELTLDASSGARQRDVFTVTKQLRFTEADLVWLDSHKPAKGGRGELMHMYYDFKASQYLRPV